MRGTAHGVDGARIAFETHGAGYPLVFLHGSCLSRVMWRGLGFTEVLARSLRVIAVDLRGHGRSDKPADPAAYDRTLLVQDVLAVLDVLELPAAHVAGYSLGGCVGFALLARAPARVTSLVSLAGPIRTQPGSVGRIIVPDYEEALLAGGMKELVRRWERARGAFDPQTRLALEANDAGAMRALLTATDHDPGADRDALRELDTPALFVTGDRDALGMEAAVEARSVMPGLTSHVLPGRDHSDLLRPPGEVLRLMAPFLRAQTPTAGGPSLVTAPTA
ncbi:alpha/beta fold hydrolase [Georgenia yuyongxinii]|uniref:Alpha/beta fold hydrolase n=1 Tax=Georgenia yuyongxinii TaxID=2589797 RepID=A0A552WY59_9MICO|nr:alpha/beta fold hydrolase [Georgenia yuyongxinii]TRW47616.1 alpha/beta fold hydrolase [Georgenia yuyongxinii]